MLRGKLRIFPRASRQNAFRTPYSRDSQCLCHRSLARSARIALLQALPAPRSAQCQSCHRVVKARLMDGNDVHIPLCQNQTRVLGGFGKVEGKQGLALFKDRRIAGVEILGSLVVQRPAAKATTLPRRSMIGKMTRLEKRSCGPYFPLVTTLASSISLSEKPLARRWLSSPSQPAGA